ncbi:MAG: hypothetical protein JWR61_3609 [Ferruginibacter sp.]|nr:hypothetical protein [Ferruginibacter sp.]
MKESELLESKLAESFISDCEEIIKILTAILNLTKCSKCRKDNENFF